MSLNRTPQNNIKKLEKEDIINFTSLPLPYVIQIVVEHSRQLPAPAVDNHEWSNLDVITLKVYTLCY